MLPGFDKQTGCQPAAQLHRSVRRRHQGHLEWVGEAWTRGDYPSQFNLDPSGTFLYVCNQRSDQITAFRIDKETGLLTFTGQYTPVGTPLRIPFLA